MRFYVCVSEKWNPDDNSFYIAGTKTGKVRQFPITDELLLLLNRIKEVQKTFGCYEDYVFSNAEGNVHVRAVSDVARNKCVQAGIGTKGIHTIRRTFNSKMRSAGVSSTIAASLLGHTEEVNEKNYTYDLSDMEYKRNIIKRVSNEMLNVG